MKTCPNCGSEVGFMLFPQGVLYVRNCFACGDETVFEVEPC